MSGDIFDIERIRRLVQLMEEHNLAEVDLRQDDQQIKLCRAGMVVAAPQSVVNAPHVTSGASENSDAESAPATDGANIITINAPMVGTFYIRPNPDSPSFVSVGSSVNPETTVCIVEAMKVFNEIPAEVSGKIVAILAQDGDAVDFGKPLFKVDTAG